MGLAAQCGGGMMRRVAIRFLAIPAVGALALLVAQPAWSAPPGTTTSTFLSPGDVPAVCDFPVEIAITAAQFERATLPNGAVIVTGPGTAEVTNLTTGESATYNVSGPGFIEPTDEGR